MSVVDSLNAYRRWVAFKGDDEERNALFNEWVQANRPLRKGKATQADELYKKLKEVLEEEIEKVSGKRDPTKAELELALDKAIERIGEHLVGEFRVQARRTYEKALGAVGRDLAYPFKLGGVHEGALKTALEGKGVAESFSGFGKVISTRFNEIIAEAYAGGALASGPIVLRMIDEVGWEPRKRLERIARTETWKIWETARSNAYKEYERETGDKLLYRFGRDLKDKKQCRICTEVIRQTQDGVPMAELERIIIAVSTDPKHGGSPKWKPKRDGGFPVTHPNCRHGHWRAVSKEIRKAKLPQGAVEQVEAWTPDPQAEVPNLHQTMGRRALQEGFSGAANLLTSEEGDKIAGAMSWEETKHPKHGPGIHINYLGADRGRGHGRKLMQQAAQEAVDRNVPLMLEPTDEAEKFYERLGFGWQRDPEGDIMTLHPDKARLLLRALRLSEPDTEYLRKLFHKEGKYCDIPGHCFASPQGLAGHAAQTGHPVPAKRAEGAVSPILSGYDPLIEGSNDEAIRASYRPPEKRDPKGEIEQAVKTRIETELDTYKDDYADAMRMVDGYEFTDPEEFVEGMIEAAEEVANAGNREGYNYTWETFMGKISTEKHDVSVGKGYHSVKAWASSSMGKDTFPLWAWAALKYNNPYIPEEIIVGKTTKPNETSFLDIEVTVRNAQGIVRKIDPTYDPETDTVVVYRGVAGQTGIAIKSHIDEKKGDVLIDHRTIESWSASPRVAFNFGDIIIKARVPVSSIVAAFCADEYLAGGEAEYIVATPHGSAYYKPDDFIKPIKRHSEQAVADTAWSAVVERLSGFRVEKIGSREDEDD